MVCHTGADTHPIKVDENHKFNKFQALLRKQI